MQPRDESEAPLEARMPSSRLVGKEIARGRSLRLRAGSAILDPAILRRESMSRLVNAAALVALIVTGTSLGAQGQQPAPKMAASSLASVEVHVASRPIGKSWYDEDAALSGPARIAISYWQPHARGRKIIGGLIPNDTVWRFGANEATTLHSDVDLTIGQLDLPRGDYSLFLLHSGNNWQLIVNDRTAMWGTDRDPAKDLGRVSLTARTLTDNEETLTVYLVPSSTDPSTGYATLGGTLRIKWGTTELSTPWKVKQ
jgi:hypothetical protein